MGLDCRGAEGVGNREGKEQLAPIPRPCTPMRSWRVVRLKRYEGTTEGRGATSYEDLNSCSLRSRDNGGQCGPRLWAPLSLDIAGCPQKTPQLCTIATRAVRP